MNMVPPPYSLIHLLNSLSSAHFSLKDTDGERGVTARVQVAAAHLQADLAKPGELLAL